jgi:hypothetical protein
MDAFEIDTEYDQDHSDDGVSRYGSYVRDRMSAFAEAWDGTWDDGTVPFACTAWRTATGPVMAPGYVRRHPRILSAQIVRNEWDGSLAADVSLITGWPSALLKLTAWYDWPSEHSFLSDREVFTEPSGEDVIRHQFLLPSARLCFSMPVAQAALPLPAESWARGHVVEEAARQAVAILVRGLNAITGPVLRRIEEG